MRDDVKQYLAAIGRRGGQKSKRKLTKAEARAMVKARTAKRAAMRQNDQAHPTAAGGTGGAQKGL
jgi:hypothetical protein